jgi:cytochrome c peroxidase
MNKGIPRKSLPINTYLSPAIKAAKPLSSITALLAAQLSSAVLTLFLSLSAHAQPLPAVPVPVENPITEAKRVLGKILFWDEQLSSDNSMACGSCHAPTAAGADLRVAAHPGADNIFGNIDDVIGSPGVVRRNIQGIAIEDAVFGFDVQVTNRAAPNFFAGIWAPQQFWDGRAEGQLLDPIDGTVVIVANGSLEAQALGPILSSVEMASDGRTWADVTTKLETAVPMVYAASIPGDMLTAITASPTYGDLFATAFGDAEITPVRIAFAIATYERTLVADQTPFDLGTLTAQQAQGLAVAFNLPPPGAPANCSACHIAPLFSDNTFRNIGVRPPAEDTGRQIVTGLAADLGRFKVPSLRNTGLKTTFMHNGSLTNLAQVIAFYAPGGQNSAVNIDPVMPIALPAPVIPAVIDFLQNGLTDPRVAAGSFPFDAPALAATGLADFELGLSAGENVPLPAWAIGVLSLLLITTRSVSRPGRRT